MCSQSVAGRANTDTSRTHASVPKDRWSLRPGDGGARDSRGLRSRTLALGGWPRDQWAARPEEGGECERLRPVFRPRPVVDRASGFGGGGECAMGREGYTEMIDLHRRTPATIHAQPIMPNACVCVVCLCCVWVLPESFDNGGSHVLHGLVVWSSQS